MAEPFLGEIRIFAGNFAPLGWALCDGQLLSVSQNDALFSLLGTTYGGDGRTTFGLPDMRGRIPVHMGTGPGLSSRQLGARSGQEQVTLTSSQLPAHSHPLQATSSEANAQSPVNKGLAHTSSGDHYAQESKMVAMNPQSVGSAGGGQAHDNTMPFLCVNFIIALRGIFPSRH